MRADLRRTLRPAGALGLLLLALALPGAAQSRQAADPAGTAEAEERGERPALAALALEYDVLHGPIEFLEVERVGCRKASRFRFRCKFFLAAYEGGDIWRGRARMRAHSFQGRSYRYHYAVQGVHKSCTFPPVRCHARHFTWKGNTNPSLFQAPGVE